MTLKIQNFSLVLASFLLINLLHISFAHTHHCHHDKLDLSVEIAHEHDEHDHHHEHPTREVGRVLQSSNYTNIKIYADYTQLPSDMDPTIQDYVQNELIPSAILYYQQTLMVVSRGKNLSTTQSTLCGLTTPTAFQNNGVDADIGFIVNAASEDTDYVAYARACVISSTDSRPIFGNVHLNLKFLTMDTLMEHEQNLNVAIHEMAHVFGISQGLFQYYYNPSTGSALTGHMKQKTVNGVSVLVIDVDPLTSLLKQYFGCSSIDGILMENQGGAASSNSHLERRIFYNELMTAGEMENARISTFMLAFLEGTGWYKGNYSMAEPIYWGKAQGCAFYYGSCMTNATATSAPVANFDEFCSELQQVGCSADRRYAATCGGSAQAKENNMSNSSFNYWGDGTVVDDIFSDNCPYFETDSSVDCQDPNSQGLAFLSGEVYGSGSKCFTGNMGGASATRTYCLQATCSLQNNSKYIMNVKIGGISATCRVAGSLYIEPLNGELDCPDPNEYCSTYGASYCAKGCMGRGQCVSNTCQCEDGWGGNDCGSKVYDDGCARCADNILETACYGDGCSQMPVAEGEYGYSASVSKKDAGHLEITKLMIVLGLIVSIVF